MLSAGLVRDAFSIIDVGHSNSTGSSHALFDSFNFVGGAKKHEKYSEVARPI
jgi:hypothetical protein